MRRHSVHVDPSKAGRESSESGAWASSVAAPDRSEHRQRADIGRRNQASSHKCAQPVCFAASQLSARSRTRSSGMTEGGRARWENCRFDERGRSATFVQVASAIARASGECCRNFENVRPQAVSAAPIHCSPGVRHRARKQRVCISIPCRQMNRLDCLRKQECDVT